VSYSEMDQQNLPETKPEIGEHEESTVSRFQADMPKTPMPNDDNIDSVSSAFRAPESVGIIANPFKNLVNGHGHEINISDESRTSARTFFQRGISKTYQSPSNFVYLEHDEPFVHLQHLDAA
jgi:hypothetical protein